MVSKNDQMLLIEKAANLCSNDSVDELKALVPTRVKPDVSVYFFIIFRSKTATCLVLNMQTVLFYTYVHILVALNVLLTY